MLYDINQIKEILPHRYPFLLIDKIDKIEVVDGKRVITGIKNVTINEPFFQGHFPEFPVMPGVLVLEALAQCGAVMVLSQEEYKGKLVFFTGANNVKWRKMVLPGDVLTLEVTEDRMIRGIGRAYVKAMVGNEVACTGEINFAIK